MQVCFSAGLLAKAFLLVAGRMVTARVTGSVASPTKLSTAESKCSKLPWCIPSPIRWPMLANSGPSRGAY